MSKLSKYVHFNIEHVETFYNCSCDRQKKNVINNIMFAISVEMNVIRL